LWVCIFGTSGLNNYELRSSRQQAARLQKTPRQTLPVGAKLAYARSDSF